MLSCRRSLLFFFFFFFLFFSLFLHLTDLEISCIFPTEMDENLRKIEGKKIISSAFLCNLHAKFIVRTWDMAPLFATSCL